MHQHAGHVSSEHSLNESDFIRAVTREIKDQTAAQAAKDSETFLGVDLRETASSFIDQEDVHWCKRILQIRDKKYARQILNHWITEAFIIFVIFLSCLFSPMMFTLKDIAIAITGSPR